MNDRSLSREGNAAPRSRRQLLIELAGAATVIAIPVGAVVATAQPIANPPSRESLGILSPERQELIEQRRDTPEDADAESTWKRAREARKRARENRKPQERAAP